MTHLVLARKYRPQGFAAVAGQEHITRTLINSIKRSKIAHAYLFCGPRGVGKTSMARIFAKALNCLAGKDAPTTEPCLKCINCEEIARGNGIAVREIDGASHNSVENVRELIDSFRSSPPPGSRYKVYIIDEVHMLSIAAFNALLKSLEEPPPNTVFILATTESHKIPETVISRCQRHDFRTIDEATIVARIKQILAEEKIAYEDSALVTIARLADGSMRDSQSILERAIVFCGAKITDAETSEMLGVVNRRILLEIVSRVLERDSRLALTALSQVFTHGLNLSIFLRELVLAVRDLTFIKVAAGDKNSLKSLGVNLELYADLTERVSQTDLFDLQDLLESVRVGADQALRSNFIRYAIEALIVRLASREPVADLAQIAAKLIATSGSQLRTGQGGSKPNENFSGVLSGAPRSSATLSPPVNRPVGDSSVEQVVDGKRINPVIHRAQLAASSIEGRGSDKIGGSGVSPIGNLAHKLDAVEQLEASHVVVGELTVDWSAFAEFASSQGSKILAQSIKLLRCERCLISSSGGELFGSGTDFVVAGLDRPEDRRQLEKLLHRFTGEARWKINLSKDSPLTRKGEAVAKSVAELEREKGVQQLKADSERALSSARVGAITKVFQGSTVEVVKKKD